MMRTETQLLFKKSKQINLSLQKTLQKQLIAIVMENPAITTTEISNLMGCSRTTVSNIISELKNLGVIEREGSDKKGTWKVKGLF